MFIQAARVPTRIFLKSSSKLRWKFLHDAYTIYPCCAFMRVHYQPTDHMLQLANGLHISNFSRGLHITYCYNCIAWINMITTKLIKLIPKLIRFFRLKSRTMCWRSDDGQKQENKVYFILFYIISVVRKFFVLFLC